MRKRVSSRGHKDGSRRDLIRMVRQMPTRDMMTGDLAVAYGAMLSRPKVIAAYPITPATPIVEYLASFISKGKLDAQYIATESEHSAMGACIGASLAGVRTFTATASQGLAYMHEFVHYAHGYHLPIVMAIANRRLSSPWATTCDYSDTMAESTSGWMQLYVENGQEALDTVIQAYKIAEDKRVLLPAMVCLDGFLISHTTEPVDIPDQAQVDDFLPNYEPEFSLDPDVGMSMPNMPRPLVIKFERMTNNCMSNAEKTISEVGEEFAKKFGRRYGLVDFYRCEEAETLLVTMGSMTGTAREAVDQLREEGLSIGLVKLRSFRPFPTDAMMSIARKVRSLAVVDRDIVHGIGGCGGALFTELKSSIYSISERPLVIDFIAGIAGREITVDHFKYMAKKALKASKSQRVDEVEWFDEYEMPSPKLKSLAKYKDRIVCPGIRSCSGCGMLLAIRHMFQTLGKNTVFTFVPGCAAVTGDKGPVPFTRQIKLPFTEVCFAGTAAVASGIKAAMKAKGKYDVNVVGLAGDGGTVDIGLQALSAAAERGDSIVYVCYDNEAYMNTGIQKSGSTPFGAWTNTTPMGARKIKKTPRKNLPAIMVAHGIPYVATASIGYIPDLLNKVKKAAATAVEDKGLAYLHIHAPCPIGWRFPSDKTVEVARLAVKSGMWVLYEAEESRMRLTFKPAKRIPVDQYLKSQRRFANLTDEDIKTIQKEVDWQWESLIRNEGG